MGWNPFNRIKKAVGKADKAQKEERTEVKKANVQVKGENKLVNGIIAESKLVNRIIQANATKHSVVKMFLGASAASRRLTIAGKSVMSKLKQTDGKIRLNLRRLQWTAGGISALPSARKEMDDLIAIKRNLIKNLANETSIMIKDLQIEAATDRRLMKKNQEIRKILDEYSEVLRLQNSELSRINRLARRRITTEKLKYEDEQVSLNEEIKTINDGLEKRANF